MTQPHETALARSNDYTSKSDEAIRLAGLFPEELTSLLDIKPYQGRQLFRWINAKQAFDFNEMTNLSKELRARLNEGFRVNSLRLVKMQESKETGTRKALLALPDGETIESVLIPARDRVTLCLSTQVGCAVKCSFCATGQSGYARNLTPGEIVEQALYLLADSDLQGRTPNIVYMGMGEPFRNCDATLKSIRLLMHKEGLGIGARRIAVSTAGEIEGIKRFAQEDWQVRLSISLHAANDALRDELVPLNRRYNLERLMQAVSNYVDRTGRQITFEWTLIADVNDRMSDVDDIVTCLDGLNATLNLIPYNPVPGIAYAPPPRATCEAFRDALAHHGIKATLRLERGQDISAACGQLRRQEV